MAPSTGYNQHGVVLQIPKGNRQRKSYHLHHSQKLFHVMQRSREWTKTMGVDTVGALNDEITHGNINHSDFITRRIAGKTSCRYCG